MCICGGGSVVVVLEGILVCVFVEVGVLWWCWRVYWCVYLWRWECSGGAGGYIGVCICGGGSVVVVLEGIFVCVFVEVGV